MDFVVVYCKILCLEVGRGNEGIVFFFERCCVLMKVMECIYLFLNSNCISGKDERKIFVNIFCILVENGKKFILFC